jgi:hypothetical protein
MGIPILIINNWKDFNSLKLNEDYYNNTWKDFSFKNIL